MATLAADNPRAFQVDQGNLDNSLDIIAADTIYDGAAVGELNDSGTYQPLNLGATTKDKFGGFAMEQCANESGAASAKKVRVREASVAILAVTGAAAITDENADVYATDDNTFTLTIGGVWIGKVKKYLGTAGGLGSTTCAVEFRAFRLRPSFFVSYAGQTTEAATDRALFVAPWPCYVKSLTEVHSVAAGGASKLQVVKDTSTDAPGAGTDLLTDNTAAGFDLAATANTVQFGTIASTAGLRKLAKGDRLSIDFGQTIQSTAGLVVTAELIRL